MVAAIIAPLLVIAILLVGNHRTIMKDQPLSLLHNVGLVLVTLILIAGSVLFFYQLATGQGGITTWKALTWTLLVRKKA